MEEYVITDGKRFVRKNINNKYEFTSNLTLADTYTCSTANHILKSCISKGKSIGFGVAKIVNGEFGSIDIPQNRFKSQKKTKEYINEHHEQENRKDIPAFCFDKKSNSEFSPLIKEWIGSFNNLKNLRSKAINRKKQLQESLEKIESCECDIRHYIEFSKLNGRQGYKVYSVFRDILRARRKAKDELEIIGYILEQYSDETEKTINHLISRIEGKNNRKYTVRCLDILFETGVDDGQINTRINELIKE